jgi:formylglycine-generating enzyme required for sulfatase activity
LTGLAPRGSGVRAAVDAATLVPQLSVPAAPKQPIAPTFVPKVETARVETAPRVETVAAPSARPIAPLLATGVALLAAVAGGVGWYLHGHAARPIDGRRDAAAALPPNLVAVPAGTLRMGRAPYGKPAALDVPEHEVPVGAFALERTEVSIGDYNRYVEDRKLTPPWPRERDLIRQGLLLPVTGVAAEEAQGYCHWRYPPSGRLPTEAEWEWAARGAEGRLYPWGGSLRAECVNGLRGEAGEIAPVDELGCGATPSGILGLSGNVWEWTSTPASAYPGSTVRVPATGEFYAVRGGSFFNTEPDELTATSRQFINRPNKFLGFRCAIDPELR